MLTNEGHLFFNQKEDLLLLPMKIHINESSMTKIFSFTGVDKIAGVHIKMDTSKGKVINVHIKDNFFFIPKNVQRVFSTPTLMTLP